MEDYFAKYNHKCNTSDYFIDNDNDNDNDNNSVPKKFVIIDILRNILIEMAIVYRIFDMAQRIRDNIKGGSGRHLEFGCKKNVGKKDWISLSIERYLRLDLLDLSILVNGVTLYHLLVYHQRTNFLKLLLHTVPCDWTVLKDNSNQV